MDTIHPDVFPIRSIASNCYLIRSKQGAVLVDTGLKGTTTAILKALGKAGFSADDLKFILITHADGDHYGSLAALKTLAPEALAYASQPEAEAIAAGRMSRKLTSTGIRKVALKVVSGLFKSTPAQVDLIYKKGDQFPWLGGLAVVESNGHTPGHLSFYSSSTGILFAGDSILVHGVALVCASGMNCWDEKKAHEAFERQLALKPKVIFGGHGVWKR
jgi:glyoxylase-like metal-dependent hydrolase (beta-lactamase superfamily II)